MPEVADPPQTEQTPESVLANFASNMAKRAAEADTKPTPTPDAPTKDVSPASSAAAQPDIADPAIKDGKPAEPDADKWPRKADDWKQFREARDRGFKERDEKISTLSKQIEELNTRTAEATTGKELESLRKERDELSDKIAMLNVVEHPKFKAYYDGKRQEQIAVAKSVLGDKAVEFEQLMAMPDGVFKDQQLEAMVADLGPISQGRVGAILNNITTLEAEKQSQIANWKQNRDAMQIEEEKQKQATLAKQQETTRQLTAEFDAAMLKVQDKTEGLAAFQKRGDPEWDAAVDNRIEYAKVLFSGKVDKAGAFQAILNAASFDGVASQALALQQEVVRLNGVIKSMQAANPTINPGGSSGAVSSEDELKPGMRPDALTGAFFKNLQRRVQQ
jgi:hypothetical protein